VTSTPEHRQRLDRRRQSRGGRRERDRQGYAPLVLVADDDPGNRDMCETILAKLNFAVAQVNSADEALAVMTTLRPDILVAHLRDVSPIRYGVWSAQIPLVIVTDEMRDADTLVEAIRRALRAAQPH
jgi:CheY-like chemotaxis protein